jgi:predicted molibdopterin-dependent oxidoreductase YjgC
VVGDGTGDVIPVVGTMLRRAVKARGAALWQLSNGGDTLSPFASEAVHSPSDQWSAMVKDLVRGLLKAGRISREALSRVGLDSKVLEDAETVTSGAGEGNWAALIEDLGKCGSFALVIPEILFAESGNRETARMLVQLAAAMGKEGSHEGCWVVPVSGQINATGALLMGVSPNRLPGLIALDNPAGRDRIQQLWQVATLPEETWASVEQALSERRLRGLFVQDAAALWAQDADKWTELLKDLEFLVLQESVPSPAVKLAHVVLPAAGFTEQAGTVFNVEHRLLSLNRVFDARGKSLADYEILMQIMAAQGIAFPREVAAIHQELAAILPAFSGV